MRIWISEGLNCNSNEHLRPVKTDHCGLWEDKKRAVYSDNEMTNKQGYRATNTRIHSHIHTLYTPDVLPEDRACARVQNHVCWGPPGMDAGDG